MRNLLLLAVLLSLGCSSNSSAQPPAYELRWFYSSHNLLVDKNVDELITLIERAEKSGYNGLMLADFKFNILDRMPPKYFANVERVKQAAANAKIEIIPAVCPFGYSEGLLYHDPNLAEGVPVKDAIFTVRGREARLTPFPPVQIVNGDMEQATGNKFAGFALQDGPGSITFADSTVKHSGATSCRMQDVGKRIIGSNCRLAQRLRVRPFACYRLSCWVKTQGFQAGEFKLLALGTSRRDRRLTFSEAELKPTQDWTKIDVVFNSVDEKEIMVYAGQWEGKTGTVWLDDFQIEELGLVNVLRRPGCPLRVTSEDGKTVYEEGKDFEPVSDPLLGKDPDPGTYSFNHAAPPIRLTTGSRIQDGQRLKVSWYHPLVTAGFQVTASLVEPKVYDILRDQVKRVNDLFHPRTFFMSHDEIRVGGWDQSSLATGQTPGALLASNVQRCIEIIRSINAEAKIAVWSDMFDPNHNARDNYYLVNGSLAGSWEGLPRDVIIANWNLGKAPASLKFFAERGHPQIIAGYYDEGMGNFTKWDAAARGVPSVKGLMYTTWAKRYKDLEAYGKAMRRE